MRYDPKAAPDTRLALAKVDSHGGGIGVDAFGWVWASHLSANKVVRIDAETLDGTTISAPSKGIAVDLKGRIFSVQYEGAVHLIEPGKTLNDHKLTLKAIPLKGIAYAYSDMTGVQTRLASKEPAWYRETFAPCQGGQLAWKGLNWDVEAPPGTWAMFNLRSGHTLDELKKSPWYTVACISSPGGIGGTSIDFFQGKMIELEVRFIATGNMYQPESITSARIKSYEILHQCTKID
jgi:hypothetical protein